MTKRRRIFILLAAVVAASWFMYARFTYPVVIARNIVASRWSKDGQAIFYSDGHSVYRFDIWSRWTTRYGLPDALLQRSIKGILMLSDHRFITDLDVSPDGRKVVLMLTEGADEPAMRWIFYVLDLASGKGRYLVTVDQSRKYALAWLSTDWIVYNDESTGAGGVWQIRPDGSNRKQLRGQANIEYTAGDGSGFAYGDRGRWQVFQAKRSQFESVKLDWSRKADGPYAFPVPVFLSSKRIAFRVYYAEERGHRANCVVDLGTNRATPFIIPNAGGTDASISPNGTHVLYTHEGTDNPSRLCLDTVPESVTKALCAP